MERIITSIKTHDFAKYCLDTLRPKQEPEPVPEKKEPKEAVKGPDRVMGLTDYKK